MLVIVPGVPGAGIGSAGFPSSVVSGGLQQCEAPLDTQLRGAAGAVAGEELQ